MKTPDSGGYKPTLFDRLGPDAVHYIRAGGLGFMVFGLTTGALLMRAGFQWWVVPAGIIAGTVAGSFGWFLAAAAGGTWKHFMVDGSSTPYEEQYSREQALVMQGKADEALESFEVVIAAKPDAVSPRIKAAELYLNEKKNPQRAAELFREAQRIATIKASEDIYATNRLVDLLLGPLGDPGRALVELRRLIERYPTNPAAEHARKALRDLKARVDIK
jgi:tetratricopeptide (TPR) repeat protein